MNEHTGTVEDDPRDAGHHPDDDIAQQVAEALRSREPDPSDLTAAAARVEARLAEPARVRGVLHLVRDEPSVRRGATVAVAGVLTTGLLAAGVGAAAASNPYSQFAVVVESAAQAVGLEWSAMPEGYTREQYEAFWGAGYGVEEVDELGALWSTDATETKARAGQLLLEGGVLPVAPQPTAETGTGTAATEEAAYEAFFDAGYTYEDATALADLWDTEPGEVKARAGYMLLEGDTPPVPPSGPGAADDAPVR